MRKIVLIIVVAVIVGAGLVVFGDKQVGSEKAKKRMVSSDCVSNPAPMFGTYPTEIENIVQVSPPIMQVGSGVKSHSYIEVGERVAVYAPADSELFGGAKLVESFSGSNQVQYVLQFSVSCEVFYYYDHLVDPVPKIAELFPGPPASDSRTKFVGPVKFTEGELVGYSWGEGNHRFDFGVINSSKEAVLKDYQEYKNSEKAHADCPLNYYEGEMRSRLEGLVGYERMGDLAMVDNLCE